MALCRNDRSFRILNIQKSYDIRQMRHEVMVTMVPMAFYYSLFRLSYRFPRTDVSDVMVAVLFVRCFVLDVARFKNFRENFKQENC
jgi:hypothetical protein